MGSGGLDCGLRIWDCGLTRPAGLALRATFGSLSRSARLTRPNGLALRAAYGCLSRSARLGRRSGLALRAGFGCLTRFARLRISGGDEVVLCKTGAICDDAGWRVLRRGPWGPVTEYSNH